jgi:hypothetical protein
VKLLPIFLVWSVIQAGCEHSNMLMKRELGLSMSSTWNTLHIIQYNYWAHNEKICEEYISVKLLRLKLEIIVEENPNQV